MNKKKVKDDSKGPDDAILENLPDTEDVSKDDAPEPDVDVWGRVFDPTIHLTDEGGAPLKSPKGKLRVQRGKGIKKSTIAGIKKETIYNQTGAATAEILFVTSIAVGGGEWQPTEDERLYMSHAWAEYFRSKGIKDLPPGCILATALISYAIPRFTQPVTKSRLSRAFGWLKTKFQKKKHLQIVPNDRQPEEEA